MATTPDTDNGYYRIANEIGEILAVMDLSGAERRVLDVVMRKTWGYNKKKDRISLSQFERFTRLPRRTITRSIATLEKLGVLGTYKSLPITEYEINKRFAEWKTRDASVPTRDAHVPKARDVRVRKVGTPTSHTKDNVTKDNISTSLRSVEQPHERKFDERLKALAIFTLATQHRFDNADQLKHWVKRNIRVSESMVGYSSKQIATCCLFALWERSQSERAYDVHLETVSKKMAAHKDDAPADSAMSEKIEKILAYYEKHKSVVLAKVSPLIKKP